MLHMNKREAECVMEIDGRKNRLIRDKEWNDTEDWAGTEWAVMGHWNCGGERSE